MDEKQAMLLERALLALGLKVESWHSGGGLWLVKFERADGSSVVFSGDCAAEYESDDALDEGRAASRIDYRAGDDLDEGRTWVIVDAKGNRYFRDDDAELGWTDEEEAEREARAWESAGEGRFRAVEE